MREIRPGWLVGAIALVLAGCGLSPSHVGAGRMTGMRAADDPDHAQINALVKDVLTSQMPYLLAHADADHDGAIEAAEYAQGRDAEVASLFLAQFDLNQDGKVTPAEYAQALAGTAAVEAYHHLMEDRMGKAIAPYQANFGFTELRSYLTKDLGLHGDWPLISKLFGELDLNNDGKLLSGAGEGPAFLQKFAQAQLQKTLNLPVTPVQ